MDEWSQKIGQNKERNKERKCEKDLEGIGKWYGHIMRRNNDMCVRE